MTRLTSLILVILISVLVGGCAQHGPYWTSPAIYGSSRDNGVAANNASQHYWEALGESYQAAGGGYVEQVGPALRAPANYHCGVLVNDRNQSVRFDIEGRISASQVVAANAVEPIALSPGRYRVRVYRSGHRYPYLDGWKVVDWERGNVTVDGEVYDFSMIAP